MREKTRRYQEMIRAAVENVDDITPYIGKDGVPYCGQERCMSFIDGDPECLICDEIGAQITRDCVCQPMIRALFSRANRVG